jgi:hypothetical protein
MSKWCLEIQEMVLEYFFPASHGLPIISLFTLVLSLHFLTGGRMKGSVEEDLDFVLCLGDVLLETGLLSIMEPNLSFTADIASLFFVWEGVGIADALVEYLHRLIAILTCFGNEFDAMAIMARCALMIFCGNNEELI